MSKTPVEQILAFCKEMEESNRTRMEECEKERKAATDFRQHELATQSLWQWENYANAYKNVSTFIMALYPEAINTQTGEIK